MKLSKLYKFFSLAASVFLLSMPAIAADQFVDFTRGAMCLWSSPQDAVAIHTDASDYPGVHIAADNLSTDILSVRGGTPAQGAPTSHIVIGTIGHSSLIDNYLPKKLKSELDGHREKYILTTVKAKIEGKKQTVLLIAGSDKRGTIYGIYELSRQLGVSPWYWWADVPVQQHVAAYIKAGTYTDGEPAVRYRGIFLNDEWPAMGNWANEHFGDFNSKMYARVFELVLRLKGNFMWPAMWNSAFYADDPLNMKTADDMGIIMGTSHHEPLGRAQKEWTRVRTRGPWNYDTNQKELNDFWRGGVERMKDTEDVLTIGMRGNGDEPMSAHADVALLERIVADQRKIIEEATGRPADQTPQVWALYKEVQEYYEKGMRVPDDVILLLCDDNWGDVRLLPDLGGKHHPGGYGMYYHVDYVGGPRNSKWLNVSQVQRMWEQLQLTYTYGVDKLWILNVGDLKPMEFPIDFFLNMAWNPSQFNASNLMDYTTSFCRTQFGDAEAAEAARILNLTCKYAHRKTAELLDKNTYNLQSGEWKQMVDRYRQLADEAQRQYDRLDPKYRDAYYQLILFPTLAMANIYDLHYAYAMNDMLARQGSQEANRWADRARQCYDQDSILCDYYNHKLSDGKWNHMIDQLHIGYTSWQEPQRRYFPAPLRVDADGKIVEQAPAGRGFFGPFGQGRTPTFPTILSAVEAADFVAHTDAEGAQWTVIPYFGIYDSGVALMPYTVPTTGASITYQMPLPSTAFTLRLQLAPTFPFNNNEGQRIKVSIADRELTEVNINHRYNENLFQGNRINTVSIKVDAGTVPAGTQRITLRPLDPGVVIERIEVVEAQ
ncbi:MAG: glycosyl hydrolase 115 family protein [Bacteroidaceae bacterium]|nr:glycosyl hydrolase 115 family protein [Bacteroidaceae bacterium]